MATRSKPPLTGLYVFMAAKKEENSTPEPQRSVHMSEIMQLWKALPESERKEYEEKASEEQKRYLAECFTKYEAKQQSGGDDEKEEDDDEMAPVSVGSEELAVALPLARVTKIIKLNTEIVKIGRDACFLVTKATEQFLERATFDAARTMARTQRKTIAHRDVVTSMREHQNPESMQVFVEELQARPADELQPPAPAKPKAAPRKRAPKGAAKESAQADGAKDGAEGGTDKDQIQLPPKKAAKKA